MNSYLPPYIKWNFRWIEDQYLKKQNYKSFRRKYKWIYLCVGKYFFQIYTKSSTYKEERLINLPTVNSQKLLFNQRHTKQNGNNITYRKSITSVHKSGKGLESRIQKMNWKSREKNIQHN